MTTGQIVGGIIGFAVGGPMGAQIGITAGGLLDPPKLPTAYGPRLSDLSFQTSSYGSPLPRVYGTVPIVGNIFWLENNQLKETVKKKKSGGKGGPSQTTKTYTYSATFAVSLCDTSKTGPIMGIRRIWIGNVLWYNAGSDDLETIIAGNQNAEGFILYTGTTDQMPDPRMQADIGVDDCPAYRRTAYIVFSDLPLEKWGNSLQAAQIKVEVVTASSNTLNTLRTEKITGLASLGQVANLMNSNYEAHALSIYPTTVTEGTVLSINSAGVRRPKKIVPIITPGVFYSVPRAQADESLYWLSYEHDSQIRIYSDRGFADVTASTVEKIVEDSSLGILVLYNYATVSKVQISLTGGVVGASITYPVFLPCFAAGDGLFALMHKIDASTLSISVYDSDLVLQKTFTVPYAAWGVDVNTAATIAGSSIVIVANSGVNSIYGGNLILRVIDISTESMSADTNVSVPTYGIVRSDVRPLLIHKNGAFVYSQQEYPDMIAMYWFAATLQLSDTSLSSVVSNELQLSNLIEPGDIDVSELTDQVRGYRIAGGPIRGAIAPLQGSHPFDLIPSGYQIKAVPRGQSAVATIDIGELGAVSGSGMVDVVLDGPSREMDTQLPRKLTIKHLDPERDYDINEQSQERIATDSVDIESKDLPEVLLADEAAGIAQTLLYVRWLERDDYAFALPPTYNALEPADVINVVAPYATIPLRLTEISYGADGVMQCKAKPNASAIYTPNATGGQGVVAGGAIPLAGNSTLLLLDTPMMRSDLNEPGFIAVMAGSSESWPGGVAFRSNDNSNTFDDVQAFASPGTFGVARGTLAADGGFVVDHSSTMAVDWLAGSPESVTEDQILSGYNYYAYGADGRWEIIAIADFDLQGDGSYLCSTILRGMYGTEWATGLHVAGDYLVLLDDPDNAFIGAGYDSFGVDKIWRGVTSGKSIDSASDQTFSYDGVNLKPLSPVNAVGARDGSNNFSATFNRRSRYTDSFWVTGVQPIVGEASESYEIDALNGSTVVHTITATTGAFSYSAANQTADGLTPGNPITFRIYQLSNIIGRGYPLEVTL